jgi:hypothetical protein
MAVSASIAILEAEARFHGEHLALYRARRYSSRPTSEARFRELTRASRRADEYLRRARALAHDEGTQR